MACRSSDAPFSGPRRVKSSCGEDGLPPTTGRMHLYRMESVSVVSPWAELCASRGSLGLAEVDTSSTNRNHPTLRIFIPACILSTHIGIGCKGANGLLLASALIGWGFSSLDAPGTGCSFRCLRLCKIGGASRCHLSGCVKNTVGNCLLSGVGSQLSLFLLLCVFSHNFGCRPGRHWGEGFQRSTPPHLETMVSEAGFETV